MKVLITGSEGFIGSHLVEELIKSGYKVRCFVLYNSFNSYGWLNNLENLIMLQYSLHFPVKNVGTKVASNTSKYETILAIILKSLIYLLKSTKKGKT